MCNLARQVLVTDDYEPPIHAASGPEPMYKRDHKAAKHPKPSPKVLRRQKWHKPRRVAVDHELVLLEISAMQLATGAA